MHITSIKTGLVGSALAIAAFAFPFAGGHASAAPKVHGTIQIVAVSTSTAENAVGDDIVIGAIVDHGHDHGVGNTNFQKIVLAKGSFEVNAAKLNRSFKVHVDAKACTITGAGVGRNMPVLRGTGAYKGISGTITLHGSFTDIGKIVKGTCDEQAQPVAGTTVIQGSGTVSY
jgi:hypothetical protein